MAETEQTAVDFGAIDFTPDWAKKAAGVTVDRGVGDRGAEHAKRPSADRDGRGFKPRRGDGRAVQGGRAPNRQAPGPQARQNAPAPFPFEVRLLPEQKALGTIFRKLQKDFHAYKLKDIAYFLLDNPASVQLRLTPKDASAKDGAREPAKIAQCKSCGHIAATEADILQHITLNHLADYYEAKEVECAAPSGNFNCVAKCGLDGVLLGPPNIHEFNATVRERIRTAHPGMSEAEYRSHIVMVRDAEAIEEWRKSATKKTVYTAKGAGEDAKELTREQAEAELRRNIAPSLVDTPKTIVVAADIALKSAMDGLRRATEEALAAERRAPHSMCAALRGAFHSRKLHFFRTNDAHGQEFVCAHELKAFDSAHAIEELAAIALFVEQHPCAAKSDIVKTPEDEKHLAWLVSTGHLVAFTNGVYSAVEKYPKYGPQWQNKWRKTKTEESSPAPAEPPASAEAPAPADASAHATEPKEESKKEEEIKDETTAQLA